MTNKTTFAAGCFWCVEAIFKELKGVESVTSGYMGGSLDNPIYKEVYTDSTGHAEVVQIIFDEKKISFNELLEVLFTTHDPTTLNRQGKDVGTRYRSEIFYHSQEQKTQAEEFIKKLTQDRIFENPIVTKITQTKVFYPAENYHQDFFENNPENASCQLVINPKLQKFRQKFAEKLKNRKN